MNIVNISGRLQRVLASPIRKLIPYANEAKRQGIKVYHLNIGDPDIKTPEVMIDVLKKWTINPIPYSQSHGDPSFLKSLVTYYNKLNYSFFGICQPEEEIIVFEPYYTNYNSYAVINGVRLVPVLTRKETNFHLPEKKEIEKKINKKTKAILICNPGNPTGTVYTKEEMEMLIEICEKNNLFLISDEVYREFVYDGKKHISILNYMQKFPKQTILVDSLSKRYGLCGVRLGMLVSLNEELMAGTLRVTL